MSEKKYVDWPGLQYYHQKVNKSIHSNDDEFNHKIETANQESIQRDAVLSSEVASVDRVAVKHIEQILSEEQKQQARENIDAVSSTHLNNVKKSIDQDIEKVTSEIDTLSDQIFAVENNMDIALQETTSELQRLINQVDNNLKQTSSDVELLNETAESNVSRITSLETDILSAKKDLTDLASDISESTEEIEKNISSMSENVSRHDSELDNVEQLLQNHSGSIEELTSAVETLNMKILSPDNVELPDGVEDTDSNRLQACFDLLANVGGVIYIDRKYVLTTTIEIKHTPSDITPSIWVKGLGKNAALDCSNVDNYVFDGCESDRYYFDNTNKCQLRYFGGIRFSGLNIIGKRHDATRNGNVLINAKRFNYYKTKEDETSQTNMQSTGTKLMYMYFSDCHITGFKYIVEGDVDTDNNYIQCFNFTNCTFRFVGRPASPVSGNSLDSGSVILAATGYDIMFTQCIVEAGGKFIDIKSPAGVSITNSLVEGLLDVAITVRLKSHGLFISNNYFETNCCTYDSTTSLGTNIDLSRLYNDSTVIIENNRFYQGLTATRKLIKLPSLFTEGNLSIINNHCNDVYIVSVPESASDLSAVFIFGNTDAKVDDPKNILVVKNTADLNKLLRSNYDTFESRISALEQYSTQLESILLDSN